MDIMNTPDIIKDLRLQKSWTQEQLAGAAGLSLRTIQRVEKDGVCSLETKQALAAVFGLDQNTLKVNSAQENADTAHKRGQLYGMIGNTAGYDFRLCCNRLLCLSRRYIGCTSRHVVWWNWIFMWPKLLYHHTLKRLLAKK
jgi:transcriptional regulator with XRE-family HTH domain